jgi:hypothetical protein
VGPAHRCDGSSVRIGASPAVGMDVCDPCGDRELEGGGRGISRRARPDNEEALENVKAVVAISGKERKKRIQC